MQRGNASKRKSTKGKNQSVPILTENDSDYNRFETENQQKFRDLYGGNNQSENQNNYKRNNARENSFELGNDNNDPSDWQSSYKNSFNR